MGVSASPAATVPRFLYLSKGAGGLVAQRPGTPACFLPPVPTLAGQRQAGSLSAFMMHLKLPARFPPPHSPLTPSRARSKPTWTAAALARGLSQAPLTSGLGGASSRGRGVGRAVVSCGCWPVPTLRSLWLLLHSSSTNPDTLNISQRGAESPWGKLFLGRQPMFSSNPFSAQKKYEAGTLLNPNQTISPT